MLLESALAHYYDQVQAALRELLPVRPNDGSRSEFTPGVELPELTDAMRDYLSVSTVAHSPLRTYRGKNLALLDLTRNPATMTTKTFASLIIVARAVKFIQETGQRVSIITPSSANKAIAMRDAVLRAIDTGLVGADQLNVTVIVPAGSVPKLRSSKLFTDPELRARNPIAVHHGTAPSEVKTIARGIMEDHREFLENSGKTNLWYTLQLENYLAADVVRALSEAEFFPPAADEPRLHVHAVSSAYGLLGHAHGWETLPHPGRAQKPPHYFLVQHLGAPDMVLSLYHNGSSDPRNAPRYAYQADSGLYAQQENQRFPTVTFDPQEVLDATFYTRNPPTSPRMNELINRQGGGGIVVSLAECLERYGQVRSLLGDAGLRLPANPMEVREWSLVMAMVGLLNAVDRELVPERDILVHGSGSYAAGDFDALPAGDLHRVDDADSLRSVVLKANAL
ncbi:DUF6002 family protein [Streptomyces inhibens]|uniref:DUF6002 family protein n=1 Tax=Streptomyces inhibens TaxID=2293571 RepID=UPI001EE73D55|nr:DUF6002 family protein [Streptomyces inhibens]UKY54131.1 DUF6002 family protein [Streptomyces inhibens]